MSGTMMTPYFHFIGGDYLFFKTWKPTSGGAIAGACIGLFAFALFERLFSALYSALEAHWRQRAFRAQASTKPLLKKATEDSPTPSIAEKQEDHPTSGTRRILAPPRTVPPFIARIDIPRGILYAVQRLLGFALMLAVMTYQAGYIISILAGLGVGEILFGRMSIAGRKNHH